MRKEKIIMKTTLCICFVLLFFCVVQAQTPKRTFTALVLYENGGHHVAFSKAAREWLDKLATEKNFTVDYINNTDAINDNYLKKYDLFIQLDYAPYGWRQEAAAAFMRYITEGRGGWIGF
jgi:basic membrane lipoprotein Med (substrate-binding protein (PBP1-ABC) superfamily)